MALYVYHFVVRLLDLLEETAVGDQLSVGEVCMTVFVLAIAHFAFRWNTRYPRGIWDVRSNYRRLRSMQVLHCVRLQDGRLRGTDSRGGREPTLPILLILYPIPE